MICNSTKKDLKLVFLKWINEDDCECVATQIIKPGQSVNVPILTNELTIEE